MFSFGKKEPRMSPKDQVRKWQKELRSEMRGLDRHIRSIERSEMKAKDQIKRAAKRGDTLSMKTLGKELVRAKKAKERIHISKAQMNSVSMKLGENMAMASVTDSFAKSTDVMRSISGLINVPEISATMRTMATEMERAGVIEEMVEDAMDAIDDPDLEDEADEEVDQVIYEVTAGQFGSLAEVPTHGVPAAPRAVAAPAPASTGRVAVLEGGGGGAGGADGDLSDIARRFESM